MAPDVTAAPAAEAVAALRSAAKEHKRLAGWHRRQSRILNAAAAGIEVQIDITNAQPKEGTADDDQ